MQLRMHSAYHIYRQNGIALYSSLLTNLDSVFPQLLLKARHLSLMFDHPASVFVGLVFHLPLQGDLGNFKFTAELLMTAALPVAS